MKALNRYLIYAFICLCLSCGTRRVETEKYKEQTKSTSDYSNEGSSDKYEAITTQQEALNINSKASQTIESGEFDKDTGKLIKGNRTANNSEIVITKNIHTTESKTRVIEKWKIRDIHANTHEVVYKSKKAKSERNGLYWVYGIVAVIGLAFWIKPWK